MPSARFRVEDILRRDPEADARRVVHRIDSATRPVPAIRPGASSRDEPATRDSEPVVASPGPGGLPEVQAARLTPSLLAATLRQSGALVVRGFFPEIVLSGLARATTEVVAACANASRRGEANRPHGVWHHPPPALRDWMPGGELGRSRGFHLASGSAMCVESPSVAEALLDLYDALDLKPLVSAVLGDAPCLSVKKWVLRETALPVDPQGWHQDGAFMGTDIHSLNLWAPLTRCGGDTGAPGMDILPRRLWRIVSPEGALFDWSVDPARISEAFPETPPVSPVFAPGDALFFDHFLLHRTQYRHQFERPRHAIETWFFSRRNAPRNQVPLDW